MTNRIYYSLYLGCPQKWSILTIYEAVSLRQLHIRRYWVHLGWYKLLLLMCLNFMLTWWCLVGIPQSWLLCKLLISVRMVVQAYMQLKCLIRSFDLLKVISGITTGWTGDTASPLTSIPPSPIILFFFVPFFSSLSKPFSTSLWTVCISVQSIKYNGSRLALHVTEWRWDRV